MLKYFILVVFFLEFRCVNLYGQNARPYLVPDEKTAIKIATAVLYPIYGKKVRKARPFNAIILEDSTWFVHSNTRRFDHLQKVYKRKKREVVMLHTGLLYVKIKRDDGKILDYGIGK